MTAWIAAAAVAFGQPDAALPEWLPDAELTAVTFVDADRGWAVGDRGVIWHTSDGGRTWKLQRSGVACRLEAVQFLDAENGIAIGGWTQAYTHQTHGVALRTRDGGRTWQNTPDLTLPGLRHVRMFDGRQGAALGDRSPLYPSGVFRTEDGGRTWTPVPKGETAGWACGDFRDIRSGAAASLDGSLSLVAGNELRPTRTPNLGPRPLTRLLLSGPTGGWLIGDGGLALRTEDGGVSWSAPAGQLPDASLDLDFRALAIRGENVWIAGAPGTCVLHSPDGGKTWQSHRTEQTAPLRGLCFLDEYRGWAVGSLGTILHTRDGGQSWRVQHSGGTRAALLGVFSEPGRVPLELVASQAGSEGYLTAIEIIGRRDPMPGGARLDEWTLPQRTHAAIATAGGSAADTAWRFPLLDSGLLPTSAAILDRWNRANDGRATERLEEHLVRRIRQWRPDVIVTEDISPHGEALAGLSGQLTLAAVTKAADETAYPQQLKRTGLAAWRVKKVLTVLPGEKPGLVNVVPSQWMPRLGRSLAEQAELARGLVATDVTLPARNVGLSLLVDRLPQDSGKRDVLSGIVLQCGGEARRQLSDPPGGNLESLSRVAQKRHNVQQLLERIETDASYGTGWLGQVGDLTKDLPARSAGDVLWQLARKYQRVGKGQYAADTLHVLLDKHPQHPLADAAALWLVQYYASGEVAWRERKQTKLETKLATAVGATEEKAAAATGVEQASFTSVGARTTAAPDLNPAERAGRAIALAKQIEQTRPTLYADPALRFAVAAAARQAGQPRTADRFFQALTGSGSQSLWAQNATAEQWLFHPTDNPPKRVCSVVTALAKPRLDGRLDDALWKVAKPISLTGLADDAASPAAAVLAFDDEFLYLAASCRKVQGVEYAKADGPRSSDTDLSKRDRITLLLDIDRDYASCWALTIDHRGWPAESCFGDATWNPDWFIAAGGDEQFWTIEAAIPLAELTPNKPQVRDVWCLGLQRIIPQVGLQSFTTPVTAEPRPEAMGLLVFE
jgi:photosystem II stability/assembly factor-like uncharacterized protein